MRKSILTTTAAAAALALAACSGTGSTPDPTTGTTDGGSDGGSSSAETFNIGVITPSGDHGFTGDSVAHAKAEAERLMAEDSNLKITVKDGLEASDQIASIENLLASEDLDLIMLWPMEGEALRSTAQVILDAGVKLVVYDRLITDFDGLAGEIMGDNFAIGEGMAQHVTEFYADDDQVNYLRFVGDSSTVTAQRSDGFDDSIDASKFNQVANTFQTNWSTDTAQTQMTDWLNTASAEEVKGLDLIVTHDDEISDGILTALESYSNPGDLNIKLITSVGGRQETLDKFEGTNVDIALTTYYFSPSFIREAERLSVSLLTGEAYSGAEEVNGIYLIPTFAISNTGETGIDFDEYRSSEIFIERYSIDN